MLLHPFQNTCKTAQILYPGHQKRYTTKVLIHAAAMSSMLRNGDDSTKQYHNRFVTTHFNKTSLSKSHNCGYTRGPHLSPSQWTLLIAHHTYPFTQHASDVDTMQMACTVPWNPLKTSYDFYYPFYYFKSYILGIFDFKKMVIQSPSAAGKSPYRDLSWCTMCLVFPNT